LPCSQRHKRQKVGISPKAERALFPSQRCGVACAQCFSSQKSYGAHLNKSCPMPSHSRHFETYQTMTCPVNGSKEHGAESQELGVRKLGSLRLRSVTPERDLRQKSQMSDVKMKDRFKVHGARDEKDRSAENQRMVSHRAHRGHREALYLCSEMEKDFSEQITSPSGRLRDLRVLRGENV
jgi:hypothetical protein